MTDRRTRLIRLGIVVAVAAIAIVLAVVLSGGGGSKGLVGNPRSALLPEINHELSGIPQVGEDLGAPKAPVTILYFGDLECPACAQFTTSGALPQLIAGPVRKGQVKIEYHSFCTATCEGPGSSEFYTQQVAAYAAGLQNRFWNYAELFYHEQGTEGSGYVTPTFLNTIATQAGVNLTAWRQQRTNASLLSDVHADEHIDQELHLQNTPTLVVQGPKRTVEVPSTSLPSLSVIEAAIAQAQ